MTEIRNAGTPDAPSTTRTDGSFTSLARWYAPYVRPYRGRLLYVAGLTVVMLACQAFVPLTVEAILHHGIWDTPAITLLLALVVLQLFSGHLAHLGSHRIASSSATLLRLRVFDRTLNSRTLRQEGLVRSSVVSRHTTDVDHVSEAFEQTAHSGIPGVMRILISLSLLTLIEWRAGLVMTGAAIVFIVYRAWLGRSLVVADRDRLASSSRVGESVDEALTAPRIIAGLNLTTWLASRFGLRVHTLENASHRQGRKLANLVTGAHLAGLVGLIAVVLFGVVSGGERLAAVAAALLYVEGVVKGLEALPPWIRSVQLAIVSRHRIDNILVDSERTPLPEAAFPKVHPAITSIDLPGESMIGIVTPNGYETDIALASISGSPESAKWRTTLEGHQIRAKGVNTDVLHIPQEPLAFNASISDHFHALVPDIADAKIRQLLTQVGIDYLVATPEGLNQPLGPVGTRLTIDERQRLALALGLATDARALLVGPLLALADTDTALIVIQALRDRAFPNVVVTARTAEVAASMDLIIFATESDAKMGTHEQLLVESPEYSHLWSSRLSTSDVDLSVLGIDESAQGSLLTRLVTESYSSGEIIYREGAPADRIVFTISGKIEILASDGQGNSRRVAVLGPGNHCGDLRLTPGEVRAETAVAIDEAVVRTLSREAISAGMSGLLDRTASERRIVSTILRSGPSTAEEIQAVLHDIDQAELLSALALLKGDGAITEEDGRYRTVQKRATKSGAADIFDRIGGL